MLWANNPFINGMSFINEADEDEEGKPSFTPPASDNDADPNDSDYTLDDGTDDEGNDPNEPQPQNEEPDGSEGAEGDNDSDDGSDEDYTLDDGTDDEGNDPQNDDSSENNNDTSDNSEESNEDTEDTGDDEDYSLDNDTDGEEGEEPNSSEGTEDDNGSDDSGDDGGDMPDPRQKLRDLENSIFDQLSEDQKASKTKELKGLFNSTYFNCQKIINNIDHVQKTPDTVKVYDYVTMTLNDLMKYIKDYLNDTFDNRTYMENVVEFEKYLSILDSIKKIFIELKTASNDSE